jgi:hypothetical protein
MSIEITCGLCKERGKYAGFLEDNSALGNYWDICEKCFDKIMSLKKND